MTMKMFFPSDANCNLVSAGHTMSELLETIQASEEELKQGLKHYECVEVDGMWFILDQDYQMMVLSRILKQVLN